MADTNFNDIIYGTPVQISVVRRANSLWALLQNDPRFSFQGRVVSFAGEQPNSADMVIELARLQGYSSCHFVPKKRARALIRAFEAAGLQPAIWNQFWGREGAIAASRTFLSEYIKPDGLTLKTVGPNTPDSVIGEISEVSIASGVMPVPGTAMLGEQPRGMMLYVENHHRQVLAVGGAFMAYHPDSPYFDEAFWGMLATHKSWRDLRLASWIGAQTILDMADQFGARGFSSGVISDNPASHAMCSRLGVRPSQMVYAGASAPETIGEISIARQAAKTI